MALFTITNIGASIINVGNVTNLGPGSCFGWKVDLDNPVTLSSDSEFKFFITHVQETTQSFVNLLDADGNPVLDADGNPIINVVQNGVWSPNIVVGDFHLDLEMNTRTKEITSVDDVIITVESM